MEDRNMPATKADLAALEERIEILRSEMQHSLQDLTETMRDGQTEVLKAFYSFAQEQQ